jgi:hypothetical protein
MGMNCVLGSVLIASGGKTFYNVECLASNLAEVDPFEKIKKAEFFAQQALKDEKVIILNTVGKFYRKVQIPH